MQQVGGYTVVRELGRGGMGVVYEVRHPDWPDAPLAMKLIKPDFADATATARFQREAEVMARIDHPNVVRVRTMGIFDEQLFLVTDMVSGESLSDMMRRGALPPEEAVTIVRGLGAALSAVHGEGVLHRDLKPANVIVRPDGTPVLLDFGVALDMGAERLTQTGAMIGTPAYMSPEQAAGEKHRMGPASDIYALGAILFALLAGRAPFEAESGMVVVKKILTEDPRWPSSDDARVPLSLEAVLRKAMAKEPHQRYRTAEALCDDLDRWARGEQPVAHETFGRAQRARWPWVAAAVGVVSVLGAAGVAVSRAEPPAPRISATPRGTRTARPEPKRDPAAELAKLRRAGGPEKVRLARAFLAGFPAHAEAARVRRELLRAGLSAPKVLDRMSLVGQPWVEFLSDGRLVLVPREHAVDADRPVVLWDLSEGKGRVVGSPLTSDQRREMETAVLHLDYVVLALTERGAQRFDPTQGSDPVDPGGRPKHRVTALGALGPWLALGYDDGQVLLRRGADLKPGPPLAGHVDQVGEQRPVWALGFAEEGALLISCSGVNRTCLRVWDTATGERVRDVDVDRDEIKLVVPAPDRPGVVLLGSHDTYRLWLEEARSGKRLLELESKDRVEFAGKAHSSHLRDAAFSPDGARIYSVSGNVGATHTSELRVWDARRGVELVPPIRRKEEQLVLFNLALDPSGARLVTAAQLKHKDASVLEVWEVDRPEPAR